MIKSLDEWNNSVANNKAYTDYYKLKKYETGLNFPKIIEILDNITKEYQITSKENIRLEYDSEYSIGCINLIFSGDLFSIKSIRHDVGGTIIDYVMFDNNNLSKIEWIYKNNICIPMPRYHTNTFELIFNDNKKRNIKVSYDVVKINSHKLLYTYFSRDVLYPIKDNKLYSDDCLSGLSIELIYIK